MIWIEMPYNYIAGIYGNFVSSNTNYIYYSAGAIDKNLNKFFAYTSHQLNDGWISNQCVVIKGNYIPDICKFNSLEEAKAICERYNKLLILQ